MAPINGEYRVAETVPNTDVERFEAGTNILIVGADLGGIRSVAKKLLAGAPEENEGSLLISLDGDVDWLIQTFAESEGGLSSVSIINGTGEQVSVDGLEPDQFFSVESPESLTELGMSLIEYGDQRGSSFDGNRVVFDSISELLAHVDEQRVFEFISAFSGRIRVSDDIGIWFMDTREHSPQTVTTFRELFDTLIEAPDHEDSTEVEVE